MNTIKLRQLGYDKVTAACDRHAAAYRRHKAHGNTRLMAHHRRLLDRCAIVAVGLADELELRESRSKAA